MLSRRAEAPPSTRRVRLAVLVAAVMLSACAGMTPMRAGRTAERAEDFDRAVVEYQKALRQRPDDYSLRRALDRVKLRAAQDHHTRGRRLAGTGKLEEALVELKRELTVILVTNNVMQASRVADRTAFFLQGRLIECGETRHIFVNPREKETHEYVSGRFG